jgi:hypothetical protein
MQDALRAVDPILMILPSAGVPGERFALAA